MAPWEHGGRVSLWGLAILNFLSREFELVESLTPGLLAELDAIPFSQKESRENPTLEIFRRANGPSLIIPEAYGGMGTRPVEAIRFQRAIAASAPSLALATNMHHFTVALLTEFAVNSPQIRHLLRNTAESCLYLASGFAEGVTAQSTLMPKMIAQRSEMGYVINGSKKPCSLSHSMDILTASVGIQCPNCGPRFGVAIVPANTVGLTVEPFWSSPILAGSESDEVILHDVSVEPQNMFLPGDEIDFAAMQAGSFIWFQILTTSCYLGIGSALMTQLIQSGKGSSQERIEVACELEGAMAMLEGVAYSFQIGERGEALVTRSLFVRYAVQQALTRMAGHAAEMLGGMAFMSSDNIAYLISAVRCLAFHPPSRTAISASLDKYLCGEPFAFV